MSLHIIREDITSHWEVETFSEVTCPLGAGSHLVSSSSVSTRASGSSFASDCTYLRSNIEGPARLKVGTSMPKLAQLAGFNN